ncbi:MAG: ketoacyl-ACP synthase III [Thermoguttaceae bacterium]
MATAKIQGVRLAGIASAVPDTRTPVSAAAEIFGADMVQKISANTGIEYRHLATPGLCTSDLCYAAAQRLLQDLQWDRESIEGLVFVTQTPDFPYIPATSCILQMRLGLPKSCAAFDVALGCSGYVYGLWLAASLLAGSGLSRVLVLAGDVASLLSSPFDRALSLLFGDAGSATALEKDAAAAPCVFSLGTDGTGWKNLIIPSGMRYSRHPRDETTHIRRQAEADNQRSEEDLYMDGGEVFAFTIREVPPLVDRALSAAAWKREEVDAFVFHQANKFMLTHLAKAMKVPLGKVPFSLREYGNTSSPSIPLTVTTQLREEISSGPLRLLLAGFGVGYSWGACAVNCGPLVVPPVILVNRSEAWQC